MASPPESPRNGIAWTRRSPKSQSRSCANYPHQPLAAHHRRAHHHRAPPEPTPAVKLTMPNGAGIPCDRGAAADGVRRPGCSRPLPGENRRDRLLRLPVLGRRDHHPRARRVLDRRRHRTAELRGDRISALDCCPQARVSDSWQRALRTALNGRRPEDGSPVEVLFERSLMTAVADSTSPLRPRLRRSRQRRGTLARIWLRRSGKTRGAQGDR
jgi:hypothetical protein